MHCAVDVRLEGLQDVRAAKDLVDYAADEDLTAVVLEQLLERLVDSPLHELQEVGLALVYCQPLPRSEGEDV